MAEEQILEAYEWGVVTWEQEQAEKWLTDLYKALFDRLSIFPMSCSIAPESDRLGREVRQYVFNRYRILFEIRESGVIVLRFTGPFTNRDVYIGLEE